MTRTGGVFRATCGIEVEKSVRDKLKARAKQAGIPQYRVTALVIECGLPLFDQRYADLLKNEQAEKPEFKGTPYFE